MGTVRSYWVVMSGLNIKTRQFVADSPVRQDLQGPYTHSEEMVLCIQIGLFSKICRVMIKTLHYYNEIVLFVPAYINPENGYRFYSSDQLMKFHQIASLSSLDLQ